MECLTSHVVSKYQLPGMWFEIDLIGEGRDALAPHVVADHRNGDDAWNAPRPVVLDEGENLGAPVGLEPFSEGVEAVF